jgi:hypothetical protein
MKPKHRLIPSNTERGFEWRVEITTDDGKVTMLFDEFVEMSQMLLAEQGGTESPVNEVVSFPK